MEKTAEKQPIAQELPKLGRDVKFEGRVFALTPQAGGWRLRSRSKSFPVDFFMATPSLAEAKRMAKEKLAAAPSKEKRTTDTLEDVARLYKTAPKRAGEESASGNVSRLRSVVREALGKTLAEVKIHEVVSLWPTYFAVRQGRKVPDYSTRRRENHGINSAVRQAASVFLPALRPYYARHGVEIPHDATNIIWAAKAVLIQPEANAKDLESAWVNLRDVDRDLWIVVGLARFAGLRQSEILAMKGKWVENRKGAFVVTLKDREEDGFFTKTGKAWSALIMNIELAEYLSAMPAEANVVTKPNARKWIAGAPQKWLKPFTGESLKPLHRLRGLYADHIQKETEEAILARQSAIKEASKNLGHTTTKTTTDHYLTSDGMKPA